MATTPNYSWVMPAPTDFVTDLPADFEIFGDAVDASLYALNPGTTAGDLDYYTSSTAKARLGIGTVGQVLTVNSGATAPEWGSAGGWSPNLTLLNAGGTALTGATTITVNVTSYDYYVFSIENASSVNVSATMSIRINGDTGTNYSFVGVAAGTISTIRSINDNIFSIATMGNSAANSVTIIGNIIGGKNTGIKSINVAGVGNGTTTAYSTSQTAFYEGTSAITSITVVSNDGNFDAGTIFVYGG
jgi:hypothetical protein